MNIVAASTVGPFDTAGEAGSTVRRAPLAILVYDDGLAADNLLAQCASDLAASGCRLGGVVQSNPQRTGRRKCDMYLRDLSSGEEILISADRGNEARGCRLDPAAFACVGVWGERALAKGIDLMIINKFGKEEARGRGLRPLIAAALIAETPVIIGVSKGNLDAFVEFAGDGAICLDAERHAIVSWCRNAIGRNAE